MRILHVTPYYYPAIKYGGPVQSIHSLNKYLVKRGIEVDVYTTNAGIEEKSSISDNYWNNLDNVKIKYFNFLGYDQYNLSPFLLVQLLKNVIQYDLIHVSLVWNFTVFSASIASILRKKPYIISPRGTLNYEAINIKSRNKKFFYFKLIAQHYLKRASAIHFTTEDEKENVLNHLKLNNRNFIVPNGIDIEEYKQLPQAGSFKKKYPLLMNSKYILFLGRIHYKKGLDLLAKAFGELSRIYPDLYMVVAGPDNSYQKELEKMLRELHVFERVVFTGLLSGVDILEAYTDAELFVLSSYSENFGMTVIEAMACGTPVVISNMVGIHREVKDNNAGIITENKVESLVDAMRSLLENRELSKKYSDNGKQFVARYYDIDKVADMMIREYEKILDSQ